VDEPRAAGRWRLAVLTNVLLTNIDIISGALGLASGRASRKPEHAGEGDSAEAWCTCPRRKPKRTGGDGRDRHGARGSETRAQSAIDIRDRKTVDARVKARVKAAVAQNRPAARKT
jgi:hypothetical protein